MTHLGAKSVAEYAQKKAEEQRAHREKYPMCTRLKAQANDRRKILDFLDWLRTEKGFQICLTGPSGHYEAIRASDEKLAHQYLEIDDDQLEKERRAMLEALQEEAG